MKKIAIIGSGFSGLSAACYLAQRGHEVSLFEKNETLGGRARQFTHDGFTFDMGPTFYWMPDVFDKFFADFNKKTADYYELFQLDPGYEICFGKGDRIKISASLDDIYTTFEQREPGSSKFLNRFFDMSSFNYHAAMREVIYRPGISPLELITKDTVKRLGQFTRSISSTIRKHIRDNRLAQVLEFPVIFLGAQPKKIPTFYCFMNYAGMVQGTFHPKGGIYKVVEALEKLASEQGVKIHRNAQVQKIDIQGNKATGITVDGQSQNFDIVISGADYHHTEHLLEEKYRNYSEHYWEKKTFAPSALMFYVGFNKKLKNIEHHSLFFDADFNAHIDAIYNHPSWPKEALFYTSFPSKTDKSLAPEGMETGIFLIPLAPGIKDTDEIRQTYFHQIIQRMESLTEQSLRDAVIFKKSYCINDFMRDYHAYKGNGYGLANTLRQTAFLKPKMKNKKVKNLFYTGQLTVPGPGVPTNIISGKIVANLVSNALKN